MTDGNRPPISNDDLAHLRSQHASSIAGAGGLEQALSSGTLPRRIDTTTSELIVLGLMRQDVHTWFCEFGHGSTEIGEVLRIYSQAGLVRVCAVRHETEAAHAAAALRWVTGQKAAVLTSIGPGALHAFAGSIVAASNGLGVWHLYGDQTTHDEGPNMQQVPSADQHPFQKMCSVMGNAYSLHTPEAIGTALRRGLNTVDHPHRPGPFFLLMPMNTQGSFLSNFNLDELPAGAPPPLGAAADNGAYAAAAKTLTQAQRVVVKVGGGARRAGEQLCRFLELADAVAVTSPLVSGVIPYDHPRNMTVGGSKGSISGNYAMEQADLLVAIGTRSVCQSDSSRTGYPNVKQVISINTDSDAVMHYNKTIGLIGDAGPTLAMLNDELEGLAAGEPGTQSPWFAECTKKRCEWEDFKKHRYDTPALTDPMWGEPVLTQPAAIKAATDWARANDAVTFFDAGDPQANGFQIVEDDQLGRTFTDTGASYMGFAVSALLATAVAKEPFYGLAISGDGSFTMNPQILIDGVEHGATGCILLLDNRRMAAISGLQVAQYGTDYATNDSVAIDYIAWASAIRGVAAFNGGTDVQTLVAALDKARAHKGLSLIHVPVYYGPDPLGGLGAFGRWNVGNWCRDTQAMRHEIGL